MDIEASSPPKKLPIVNGRKEVEKSKSQSSPSTNRVPGQPVQPTGRNDSPDLSSIPDPPEHKTRRNTTKSLCCPEPSPSFQNSPRAASQPMPPAVQRSPSPTQTTQAKVEEPKIPQQAPPQPRSPPRSPPRGPSQGPSRGHRGGNRGRGFRGRYRGRGRGNSSKSRPVSTQGGISSTSITSSQAPPSAK